jgi:hypothetical protein
LLALTINTFIKAARVGPPALAVISLLETESVELLLARRDHAEDLVVAC